MEDTKIIELYFDRDERALVESETKYGAYCNTISYNITASHEDAEECVNETWLRAWNSIPPQFPTRLMAFFAKIVRNLSLDLYRRRTAQRRGGDSVGLALDELSECIASQEDVEQQAIKQELSESINAFLKRLSERDCNLFLRRYFYMDCIDDAAKHCHISSKHAAVILHRLRQKLADHLQKEGYV